MTEIRFNFVLSEEKEDRIRVTAHKDIIHPDGNKAKQPLYFQTFNAAFTFAIQDIKISWKWYRIAYRKELSNEERNSS